MVTERQGGHLHEKKYLMERKILCDFIGHTYLCP